MYTVEDFSVFFRLLANETRFNILKVLHESDDRKSVSTIAKDGNISMSKISDQLMVLRKSKLVDSVKDGIARMYALNTDQFKEIVVNYVGELKSSEKSIVERIIAEPFSDFSFKVYKALANETRCEMLCKISEKDRYVNELCDMFYLEQPTISMHLKMIQDVDLIFCKKIKTKRYYALKQADA